MIKNMERKLLGMSVALIMSAQSVHASNEYTQRVHNQHTDFENYALSAEYSEDNLPSYSNADPAPVDKAIIGSNDDFSRLLAADLNTADEFGYMGVQVSARIPALPMSDSASNTAAIKDYETPVVSFPSAPVERKARIDADELHTAALSVTETSDVLLDSQITNENLIANSNNTAIQKSSIYKNADTVQATPDTQAATVTANSRRQVSAQQDDVVEEAIEIQAKQKQAEAAQQTTVALPPSRAQQNVAHSPTTKAANYTTKTAATVSNTPKTTPSMVAKKPNSASDVLKKQKDDASSEKNLKEVFTASEKRYSLLKKGKFGLNYDARYSYYRDSRIDIATKENSSEILRFRVEEDAQHTLTNTLGLQYGLRDNLTLSADLPVVTKTDLVKDAQTVGLGDIGLGVRWEPFPLEKGRLPLIFSANITLPTGDSPYEIDRKNSLATGRGYYGFGGGVSTRKYIDPVVLFGSASANYGIEKTGLSQSLGGNTTLTGIKPNLSLGIALGFAYSLNYDVSLTMSYQQAFSVGSEFTRRQLDKNNRLIETTSASADQTSATLNMALGLRVSPKTIVNTSIGIGLTEDTPDVSFGVSFPLNFGFGNEK